MKLKRFLLIFGILCLVSAAGLSAYNLTSSDRAGQRAEAVAEELMALMPPMEEIPAPTPTLPDGTDHPEREMPVLSLNNTKFVGYLEIPQLGLTLPVAASFSMNQLKSTPALYSGSVYRGDMVIAAHNYNSHFGRLNQLKDGDEVRFICSDGTVYRYTVGWSEKIAPSDRETMVTDDRWDLTLFTCTYNGKQRFTLRCVAAEG